MNLIESDDYTDLAAEWQYQMILILKEKLKKFGVEDMLAKDIVGEFTFDFAMLHDQEEIQWEGKAFNPRIGFDDFSGNIITTSDESFLHEYAFGSTSEVYAE